MEGWLVGGRTKTFCTLSLALALWGCATRHEQPPSLKDTLAAVPPPVDRGPDCGGRHLDREAGKPPAGATTLEQKEADDQICGERYRYPGYLKPN